MKKRTPVPHPYVTAFYGSFISMLRWEQLDALWEALSRRAGAGWYIYAVGDAVPETPYPADKVHAFIERIDRLLREEHQEDYCGIVYADSITEPTFIKIYDPNNLGAVCGSSAQTPLPGWVLSLMQPTDLKALPQTGQRRRWWQKLLG